MPIFDVNEKMKVIVTSIVSSSGEIVKAMTYFQPNQKFNTWYPTIIVHVKAEEGKHLENMVENKIFSGTLEFTTSDNFRLNYTSIKDNNIIFEDKFIYNLKGDLMRSSGSKNNSKLMVADSSGGGLVECLKAADVCATQEMKDMGVFALAACVATLPACVAVLYADCMLHEKACLGVDKPLAE